MNSILEIFNDSDGGMHHAYLIVGDLDENLNTLRSGIEKLIDTPIGNYPDYFECIRPNFVVADSELFISKQSTMSFGGGKRFFALAAQSFTPEAQNKLLKVLEEPLLDNHVFIFSPTSGTLLPTLLSRLSVVQGDRSSFSEAATFCVNFTSSSLPDRLIMIEKFLKANDDDDESTHVKHKAKDIFGQLEKTFSDRLISSTDADQVEVGNFLVELIDVKKYLDDSAPAVRLIFEYVAFICPRSV